MRDVAELVKQVNTEESVFKSEFVWGAQEIGRAINRTPRQVFNLLAQGRLKSVRKIGGSWCANREALRRELGA